MSIVNVRDERLAPPLTTPIGFAHGQARRARHKSACPPLSIWEKYEACQHENRDFILGKLCLKGPLSHFAAMLTHTWQAMLRGPDAKTSFSLLDNIPNPLTISEKLAAHLTALLSIYEERHRWIFHLCLYSLSKNPCFQR